MGLWPSTWWDVRVGPAIVKLSSDEFLEVVRGEYDEFLSE